MSLTNERLRSASKDSYTRNPDLAWVEESRSVRALNYLSNTLGIDRDSLTITTKSLALNRPVRNEMFPESPMWNEKTVSIETSYIDLCQNQKLIKSMKGNNVDAIERTDEYSKLSGIGYIENEGWYLSFKVGKSGKAEEIETGLDEWQVVYSLLAYSRSKENMNTNAKKKESRSRTKQDSKKPAVSVPAV